jgi:S1-C subfamily serine protease
MRAVLFALAAVLLVHAIGWTGFLTAGEVGVRGGGPSPDVPGARAIVGVAPGSAADRAGLRAGDVVVARDGFSATDPAYDRATVAARAGQGTTLRIRRAQPSGGHGPEEDVALVADPLLAAADKARRRRP